MPETRSPWELEKQTKKLQETEKALRETEEKYRTLVEQADDAILILQNGRTIYRNPKSTRLLGYTVEETAQQSFLDFVDEQDRARVRQYYEDRLNGLPAPEQYELRLRARNGDILAMEVRPSLISIGGRPATMVIMRDLTERRKAEEALRSYHEKLRSLASQLSLAEEKERRRISTHVHDHIGQNLAFAKLKLMELKKQIAQPELKGMVQEICGFIDDSIGDTRCLVSELGSPVLYELGFVPAVQALVGDMQQRHGIPLTLKDDGRSESLSQDVKILLYRAVRELLANMVKHSNASSGVVSIKTAGRKMTIEVEDNGIGFDSESLGSCLPYSQGYGLFSIRERLEPLGGQVAVDSQSGRGTRVVLTVPLPSSG